MSDRRERRGAIGEWLEQRVGWRKLMHEALDEPVPGGPRWAYVFGSGLLFIFVNQIVTGVVLSLYYVPSVDHAHTTVSFIHKVVTGGQLIRSLHSYGSSVMIVVLMLHLAQTFFYGAYKSRRELLWLAGCFLFLLVLGMAFTGYLLPWDRRAYFATAVGTNIVSEVPLIGPFLKTVLRAGAEMGTLTLSRFFVLHVFAIPALMFVGIGLHLFFFRRRGAAGPPLSPEKLEVLPAEPFFPGQVVKDFVFGILLIVALGVFATFFPATLGPVANPSDATYVPRPEWYYLPAFQWLKYWRGNGMVIGIILIPLVVFGALFLVPFLDRSHERNPFRRPFAIGLFVVVLAGIVFLGFQSYAEDRRDPSVRAKLKSQAEAEEAYMKAPFEPEQEPLAVPAPVLERLSGLAAQGALLFEKESCSSCHGAGGRGEGGLTKLWGMKDRYSEQQLAALLRNPQPSMLDGGMEAIKLPQKDLDALVAYMRETMNTPK